MASLDFDQIQSPLPDLQTLQGRYRALHTALASAGDVTACREVVEEWDGLRRDLQTGSALAGLKFRQNTTDEQAKENRRAWEELGPKLTELAVDLQRKLLAHPLRTELEKELGPQAFALWESTVMTYAPEIEEDVVTESELVAEYTELMASMRLEFQGEQRNLSSMRAFLDHADRSVREAATRATWSWFGENAAELDRIFDELVQLRTGMAKKLGFSDFVELGYRRMKRVDYDRDDVERFRKGVRDHVVPFAMELRSRQAESRGVELCYWDEGVHDMAGNPRPQGGHDWMMDRAREMFDAMDPEIGSFFHLMADARLTDLETREGKAGGGFCTSFPSYGVPFIFANFTGTKGDVEVFTHEVGHAYQNYLSQKLFPVDYIWATSESAEIHSMSLEYLTWPHMERFFGEEAERYRRVHQTGNILFLPYGVAVDHFQHMVYERPDATPAERCEMWREVERMYLPWRRYDGIERLEAGGFWQMQLHVYNFPFYYIDYTLAEVCAMQFRDLAREDEARALEVYRALCRRGGSLPFQGLVRSAGLMSPLEEGCLEEVVGKTRALLS